MGEPGDREERHYLNYDAVRELRAAVNSFAGDYGIGEGHDDDDDPLVILPSVARGVAHIPRKTDAEGARGEPKLGMDRPADATSSARIEDIFPAPNVPTLPSSSNDDESSLSSSDSDDLPPAVRGCKLCQGLSQWAG